MTDAQGRTGRLSWISFSPSRVTSLCNGSSATNLSNDHETRKMNFENKGGARHPWEPRRRSRTAACSEGEAGRMGRAVPGQRTGERGARQRARHGRGHHGLQGQRQDGERRGRPDPGAGPTTTAAGSRGKFRNGAGGWRPSALWPIAAPPGREATAGLCRPGFPGLITRGFGFVPARAG